MNAVSLRRPRAGRARAIRSVFSVRRALMLSLVLPLVLMPAWAVDTRITTLDGQRVTLDVYAPVGPLRGAAVLSHGFTRSRSTLGEHAAALAQAGVLALTPDLPHTFDFRGNARALAALVAGLRAGGEFGPAAERVMLVGFSAGALSSLLAAASPGVVGYVGLDPFDRVVGEGPTPLGLGVARTLATPALIVRAPASACNARSVAAPWATALTGLVADRVIEGATHCDFEAPTDWICRLACGSADAGRQARVRAALLEAADRWLLPSTATPADSATAPRATAASAPGLAPAPQRPDPAPAAAARGG